MKKIFQLYAAVLVASLIFFSCSGNKLIGRGDQGTSISYQNFYDDLSPYGSWIDYPSYGQVWHPNISGNFRPYLTNGYWDYSNAGWMWMSNYNWGWAPFHYGRWVYDDFYGWLWVPGYDWSPAWVTWGYFGDNYCWAPLMPGINIGTSYGSYRPHSFYWNAVPRGHIYDRDIDRREIPRDQINNRVNNITVINNFSTTRVHNQYYSKGPDVKEVEKFTSRTISPASISERNTAGPARRAGDKVEVYRPGVNSPQPKEFRRTDNDHARPLIQNQENPDQSVKGIETPRNNNKENQENTPAGRNDRKVPEPAHSNDKEVTAPTRMQENPSRPMIRREEPIRNNEMEQRQNLERLPMYHSPAASSPNRPQGDGNRRR